VSDTIRGKPSTISGDGDDALRSFLDKVDSIDYFGWSVGSYHKNRREITSCLISDVATEPLAYAEKNQ
jgi:hypothetical protein